MKKRIIAILTIMIMVTLFTTGCDIGSKKDENTKKAEANAENGDTSKDTKESPSTGTLKGQNVRVVIGSNNTSGDSYMIADLVTRYLSKEMGFNGKVDAIGNASALDVIANAKGDGKTVMMFHDMTFMSVLFGSIDEKYSLENMTVGPRIGQNPGACFGAAAESPYQKLSDVTKFLKENPDKTVSFNIESGGTSHLCFSAYYLDVQAKEGKEISDRIKAIVGGTTAEKLQRLWDRNTDVIFGDTSTFEQYTKSDVEEQLRMNMFDSCGKVPGVDIETMAEDGIEFDGESFEFAKDFAMYFPKDMDEAILKEYALAMQKVTENPDFIAEMNKLYYNALSKDEVELNASKKFIYAKRSVCEKIIEQAPDLDEITK